MNIIIIKKLGIITLFCFTCTFIQAQEKSPIKEQKDARESRKIAFFSSKMQLSSEEAKNFWPIVTEMETEIKELKSKNSKIRTINSQKDDISDEELEKIMDTRMEMGRKQMDIKLKYYEKFKEVLPIQKVAKYYQATTEFKKLQAKRSHHNNSNRK